MYMLCVLFANDKNYGYIQALILLILDETVVLGKYYYNFDYIYIYMLQYNNVIQIIHNYTVRTLQSV